MTGRQLKIQAIGSGYEAFAEAVLGQISSMIPVAREHDYGIDFYCLPRRSLGHRSETTVDLCGIQVKGGSNPVFSLGGTDPKTMTWRGHEIEWLRSLRVPLYLATVDARFERVNLYSTAPALSVFWKAGTPYQIDCALAPPQYTSPTSASEPASVPTPAAAGNGDGHVWNVDLGPPILSLALTELGTDALREEPLEVFLRWITVDRWSLVNLWAGIPRFKTTANYITNRLSLDEVHWMFWNTDPSADLNKLAQVLVPGIVTMTRHLIAQGRHEEARLWRGPLRWCLNQGWLESFGREVLNDLEGVVPTE